ncbi:MAG: WG repeat-containing protein [Pseudomonadota bacterium]
MAPAEGLCPQADKEWSAQCFEESGGVRRIKSQHLKRIVVDKSGHAVIVIDQPRELVAVDRKGVVVVPGIFHTGDFDYPDAEKNLGRFSTKVNNASKCGYFNGSNFRIIIPASYDQCQAFHEGTALACKDCEVYCTVSECQDSVFVGGTNFILDGKNKVVRKPIPMTPAEVCGGQEFVRIERDRHSKPFLNCLTHPTAPLK